MEGLLSTGPTPSSFLIGALNKDDEGDAKMKKHQVFVFTLAMSFLSISGKESQSVVLTADMKPTAEPMPRVINIRKNRIANSWTGETAGSTSGATSGATSDFH